jgi:hypothetical protein
MLAASKSPLKSGTLEETRFLLGPNAPSALEALGALYLRGKQREIHFKKLWLASALRHDNPGWWDRTCGCMRVVTELIR